MTFLPVLRLPSSFTPHEAEYVMKRLLDSKAAPGHRNARTPAYPIHEEAANKQ
jgi:hypothetical protein